MSKYNFYIGIDCGTMTGFAVWYKFEKKLVQVKTVKIHAAMQEVLGYNRGTNGRIFVRVEDARKRTWFGNSGREQLQGAGSIKRDAVIWEDFLIDCKIPFEMVAPKHNRTKIEAEYFKKLTGWSARTSVHGRDAAMLVYGF